MTKSYKAVIQQALDWFENNSSNYKINKTKCFVHEAVQDTIRLAIAQPESKA